MSLVTNKCSISTCENCVSTVCLHRTTSSLRSSLHQKLQIINSSSGQKTQELECHARYTHDCVLAEGRPHGGRRSEWQIRIWNVADGSSKKDIEPTTAAFVRSPFSPDGKGSPRRHQHEDSPVDTTNGNAVKNAR